MENLLQALINADRICKQANPYFEKRDEIQGKIAVKNRRFNTALKCGFLVFLFACLVFSSAPFGMLLPIATTAAYILLIKSTHSKKVAVLEKQAQKAEDAGMKIFRDHEQELAFLPEDYWFPLATGYLIKVVKSGRVNSLNEALDMLDAQLHRWNVEAANDEILAQQQEQTAHLKSIRRSNKVNAAANVANAFNNINKSLWD